MAKGIRIDQLAVQLGVRPKDILARLRAEGLGDVAPAYQSTISVGLAETLCGWFKHDPAAHGAIIAASRQVEPVVPPPPADETPKKSPDQVVRHVR